MSRLRKEVIKLAFENPKLREDLLPLLRGKKADLRLTPGDVGVLKAFLAKTPANNKKFFTDGTRLDGLWTGGNELLVWEGRTIEVGGGSAGSAAVLVRWLKKNANPSDLGLTIKLGSRKTAGATGQEVLYTLLGGYNLWSKVQEEVENKDRIAGGLMVDVTSKLADIFDISVREAEAMHRLIDVIKRGVSMDGRGLRNILGKAAVSLGLKPPMNF